MTTHWMFQEAVTTVVPLPGSVEQALCGRLIDRLIPGNAPRMQRLKQLVEFVAPCDAPALVIGPSGSGKELVAEALHRLSGRRGEFVAVNCAAIPAELLEGELFGHEKGAFTGAERSRTGLIELAAGGTLFLDEIGDMPLAMQAKLLRVLESRQIRRVGGNGTVSVDFRVVAATHRGLEAMVTAGTFRADLFYRLSAFPLDVPALSERPGDLPVILERLVEDQRKQTPGFPAPEFDTSALRALAARDWPGNIRELRSIVQRAFAFFGGQTVTAREVERNLIQMQPPLAEENRCEWPEAPSPAGDASSFDAALSKGVDLDLRIYLRDIEVSLIEAALGQTAGCVTRAAEALRLRRTTLIEKMKKYGIAAAAI
ncbi:sigma-54-dependent Fis family transcriptional regulator [Gemmobacter lanyuensis]|uniref:Nif-specific regulatory protein n=1 Tax=Gemmobacter lanyuensis TaxID=1054497 RepID=A0A918ILE3_9RHOB|nr:sigma-54 dependent transcriptional regulator [Gemmobacter lanyuensis]GGW21415.1 sigma-54-dependent Fis family transcriptional regulator [Gemmobacter lanyuensis]